MSSFISPGQFSHRELRFAWRERAADAMPDELSAHSLWQADLGRDFFARARQINADLSPGVRDGAGDVGQLAEEGPNSNALEAGRGRVYAEDGAEELIVRARPPGVTVGACPRVGDFRPGGQ